jgi:cysteine desulfurase/selenocysteine lyase
MPGERDTAASVITARSPTGIDPLRLRQDFPILQRPSHSKPLVFLDSAASAQKPRQVIDRLVDVYETSYANVHRGIYELAESATARYEESRDKVAEFLNARSRREVIFVRQATEALNLVAHAYGRKFIRPGDVIVATEMEHHSNLVPWQVLAERTGATIEYLRLTDTGELDPESLERLANVEGVRLLAVTHISNSLGTVNDIPALAGWAHERGAVIVVDGAQAAPHRPVDVQALGCDFYAVSGHKMCGMGAGVLWGREELLERMDPFLTGGSMIRNVSLERTTWNDLPWKFEAGTPAIGDCIALGAAVDYLEGIGMEEIQAHERALTTYGYELLAAIPEVTQYGPPPERRGGIFSFTLGDVHPHDVAQVLDGEGIAVRASHHCTEPVMRRYGIAATTRASVYLYNDEADLDRLGDGLRKVARMFAR